MRNFILAGPCRLLRSPILTGSYRPLRFILLAVCPAHRLSPPVRIPVGLSCRHSIRHTIHAAAHLSALSCNALLNVLQKAVPCCLIKILHQRTCVLQNSLCPLLIICSADIGANLLPLRHHFTDGKLSFHLRLRLLRLIHHHGILSVCLLLQLLIVRAGEKILHSLRDIILNTVYAVLLLRRTNPEIRLRLL